MANTTNFGWETPDDTDLVKDGAAAMRTLGNAIDASLVDLKGGTTNQVLAKNSNTDMDFKWVETDDTNAIQNAIVDAKGDLIAASAADTPARLAVGNNGDTLVADSSASTGLRWQASQAAGKNGVINGAMDVWQRGTANVTTASVYTADRWFKSSNTAFGVSFQTTSDTTNLPQITYALRMQRTNGSTSTTAIELVQNLENQTSAPFIGQAVTLSFYARAGANFSAASSIFASHLYGGTGTDQNLFTGMTGNASLVSANNTLTTTWQRFQITTTVSTTYKQLAVYFTYTPTGTAGANDWVEITGVQLELGSRATTFTRAGGTLAGELAACQRYYWRNTTGSAYGVVGTGYTATTTQFNSLFNFPVPMRITPTSVDGANLEYIDFSGSTGALSSASLSSTECTPLTARVNWTVSGATAGRGAFVRAANNTAAYIGFSAEL